MSHEWEVANARVNALLAELDAPRTRPRAGLRVIPAQASKPIPARLSEEYIAMLGAKS